MSEEVKTEVEMSEDEKIAQEAFNQALGKNKEQREERKNQRMGGTGGGSFEQIEWMGLEDQVEKVFRIIGLPAEFRNKGTDPKIFCHSKILTDKKTGYMNIIWDADQKGMLNEDWILKELFDVVFKREFVKYKDGHQNEKGYEGEYQYTYKDTETFKRLNANMKKEPGPKFFAPKSRAKTRVAMNVIDRHDKWCQENKHSKVLSSKHSYWKDDTNDNPIYFSDRGVPEMTYNLILDNVVGFRTNWFLDIVAIKNSKDINNAYIVKDILEEKISEASKKIGNADPLTDEEKAYELYNFDEMKTFKVTPYYALYKNVKGLFKMFDVEFNQNFTERLETLASEEKSKMNAEEKTKLESEVDEEIGEQTETPTIEKTENTTVETNVEVKDELVQKRRQPELVGINYLTYFPSWDSLTSAEKKVMEELIVEFKDTIPVYRDPSDAMPCVDKGCKFLNSDIPTVFPSNVVNCPVCGKKDNTQ